MNNFKAGDYIVLLSSCDGKNCWEDSMPIDHCYQLRDDCTTLTFSVKKDISLQSNGWSGDWRGGTYYEMGGSYLKLRAATESEIQIYKFIGRPFHTLTRMSLLNKLLTRHLNKKINKKI